MEIYKNFQHPLMENNITKQDRVAAINFLKNNDISKPLGIMKLKFTKK